MTRKLAHLLNDVEYNKECIEQERWIDLLYELSESFGYIELVQVFEELGLLNALTATQEFWGIEECLRHQTMPYKTIVIPPGVRSTPDYAFYNSFFKSVKLPSSLKFLSQGTFSNTLLSEPLILPRSLIRIEYGCFEHFSAPKLIYEGSRAEWAEVDGHDQAPQSVWCNDGRVIC